MVLNINYPPVIVYNILKELMDLSTEVSVPNTQAKIVTISVEMIQKNQYYETGLSKWF